MARPEGTTLKDWYTLHDKRKKLLEEKKEKYSLSHSEEVMLAYSILTVLELEEMITTFDDEMENKNE